MNPTWVNQFCCAAELLEAGRRSSRRLLPGDYIATWPQNCSKPRTGKTLGPGRGQGDSAFHRPMPQAPSWERNQRGSADLRRRISTSVQRTGALPGTKALKTSPGSQRRFHLSRRRGPGSGPPSGMRTGRRPAEQGPETYFATDIAYHRNSSCGVSGLSDRHLRRRPPRYIPEMSAAVRALSP